jgi:hypothetical protein
VRAWIEHLPTGYIDSWSDLHRVFVGNFQGTYVRPSNSWDLRNCRQKVGETLRKYIRCFSKQCNDLPDVIGAFIAGTANELLVHELRHNRLRSMRKLFNIATSHALGEDAV